ncbi:MAG: hypothetical protein JNK82_00265, partial [Myxococcaceae bacterium]|nr:hypothetical protein [Myxococcaceae bacterium]
NCGEFDGGAITPDHCNTPEEALSDTANCVLPLACGVDGGRVEYIHPPNNDAPDQDWYSASFDGTVNARTLLRVSAGYIAPSTPVALSVTVLREGGTMSIAREIDDHGAGAPRPIDIILPYTEPNSKLLFLVADKGGRVPAVFDVRSPYFISVCTQENPDVNEPNDSPDAGGTPIPIPASGMELTGTQSGYLATDNDVDRFSIDVPANMPGPRNILYVHVTTPMELTPPPPYRLSFTLYDPNGVPIAEQVTPNAFLRADLATAKLVRVPGRYTLVVQGYKANPNDMTVVAGDLRQRYDVTVRVMRDEDVAEPDDSLAEGDAKATVLGVGNSLTVRGRISYVPDPAYVVVDLPPAAGYTTLYARLTASSTAGRFAPLSGPKDRQLRILSPVQAMGAMTGPARCKADPVACPKGYVNNDTILQGLVAQVCDSSTDAGFGQCLWAERNQTEVTNFANLRNMQASIPVAPHGGNQRFYIVVGDEGNNWADDVEWTLFVRSDDDPDEARFAGGPVAGSANGQLSGVLTHGYGRTLEYDLGLCAERPDTCRGVRSPNDYDAVPTDTDPFLVDLPATMDETWGLSWDIFKVDGGTLPGELLIGLGFGAADGGASRNVSTGYVSSNFSPWYSDVLTDRVFGWERTDMGSFVRVTARPNQCLCFQGAFPRVTMTMSLVDRNDYAPLRYQLNNSTSGWTGIYPGDGGMPAPCGLRQGDGGLGTYACGLP